MNDNENNWLIARGKIVKMDQNNKPQRMTGTYQNINERKDFENKLLLLATAFNNTTDAVIIFNADLCIINVNKAFSDITRIPFSEIIGINFNSLGDRLKTTPPHAHITNSLTSTGIWNGELKIEITNKEKRYLYSTIVRIYNEKQKSTHHLGTFRDVSKQKSAEDKLRYLANNDVLTRLPNRNVYIDRLNHAIISSQRNHLVHAVVFLDLDRFKNINDSLGHDVGDSLLLEVANRIKSCLRITDTISRFGGDEFTILLEDIKEGINATIIARNLILLFESPFKIHSHEIKMTVSMGICIYPDNGEDVETLLRNADTALYSAKLKGRNNFQFYSPQLNNSAIERIQLESELRHALDRKQLYLVYQPKVDSRNNRIIGAEVLLRWNHPELGLISPAKFIPLAEETGHIIPIGAWVLENACKILKHWLSIGFDECTLSINVSPIQFRSGDLAQDLAMLLHDLDIPAHHLDLELTESLVMENPDNVILLLRVLKKIGVKLSIDDFGTGYSSLNYLQRFPIDTLKIDYSFVKNIPHDHGSTAITTTIISMAKNLGLDIVAEGVENIEQLQLLNEHDCHIIQGFLFSKPVRADKFEKILANGL